MISSARPGRTELRAQLPALLLLVVCAVWGVFRTAHVLSIHSHHLTPTHDLYTYYSIWYVFGQRDCADLALRGSLYLPHTWLFFTPIFMFGWPVARALMFVINTGAVLYIWWRLSQLADLQGLRRWLFLAFFCSWSAVGNVMGLGNLALVCLAAVLAAYPFKTPVNGLFLALAAMKQSLVFPLYLHLMIKRPRVLIIPFVVFAVTGLAMLWWTGLTIPQGFKVFQAWIGSVGTWTMMDHTCLRRPLSLLIGNKLAVSLIMWTIWFTLFGLTTARIKDPLVQLAALLLLCLLPMYHYAYDMVVAAPMLAILLKRCRLIWPALMTFALAWDPLRQISGFLPAGSLRELALTLQSPYLPLLILVFLGGLHCLESKPRTVAPDPAFQPG